MHLAALFLITGWFLTSAYLCYKENKEYGDELHMNYKKFYDWSSPYLKKSFNMALVSPDFIGQWKYKITYVLCYF